MIEADQLTRRFGGTTALDRFDLTVAAGTVHGLLGPNGAGKTTAVRILTTLLRPDAGTARVAGHDVQRAADRVRARIGLVGQHAAVDELLSGRQNLEMFGRLHHLGTAAARRRADELLERFGLADTGDKAAQNTRAACGAGSTSRPACYPPGRAVPRRADHRARPARPHRGVARGPRAGRRAAPPSCSPPSTSRRPTSWPTGSPCSTTAGWSPPGTPDELKGRIGADHLDVVLRDADRLDAAAAILASVAAGEPSLDPDAAGSACRSATGWPRWARRCARCTTPASTRPTSPCAGRPSTRSSCT